MQENISKKERKKKIIFFKKGLCVISSGHPCTNDNARFATVTFKYLIQIFNSNI